MLDYQWIQVSRPFEILKQQLLALDPQWFEDAVRAAAEPHLPTAPESGAAHGQVLQVRVRVEHPRLARGIFTLPMRWEVAGSALPTDLRGEIEVLPAGHEARVGVRMLPPPGLLAVGDEEVARAHHAVNATTGSFLKRLFWTLEALSRDAGRQPPHDRN